MKKRLNLLTLLTLSLLIRNSLIRNANKLPSNFTLCTNNRLSTVNLSHKDIGKIIQNLNPNKVPENENINICMLKIFVSFIYVPLELIFNKALVLVCFHQTRKKRTLFLSSKKVINLESYRQLSLLQYLGKSWKD